VLALGRLDFRKAASPPPYEFWTNRSGCRKRHVGRFVFLFVARGYGVSCCRQLALLSARFRGIPAIFLLCPAFFLCFLKSLLCASSGSRHPPAEASAQAGLFLQSLFCKFFCKPLANPGNYFTKFVNAHGLTSYLSVCLPKPRRRQVLCSIPTCLPPGRPERRRKCREQFVFATFFSV